MRIGIDLGGTKIEGLALGPDGRELACRRVPTPQGDYPATVAAVRDLVAALEAETGESGTVGVGTPGAISPATGLIKNANSTCLIGQPLDRDLEAALGRPVRLANDADCFALSEATDGAALGAETVFGVILGTGVGGGIVHAGRLLSGPNAIAGEWGHNPLPWPADDERPGPACYCGKSGCIETFLSGPGLERFHAERTGQPTAAADISNEAVWAVYQDRLARALAQVINLLDPHVIVLGGGLSKQDRLYAPVEALLPRYVFSDRVATAIRPPAHGDSSGVRGAAWLWPVP
ncbi:MAG: ROK family protein [Minwuia sp.]|uniref:ROK family protein n=1 Tax=Minwuia sp. TaxID=2493630 RepID=UPI003A85BB3E